MDPGIRDLPAGDVLIQGTRIEAVSANLQAAAGPGTITVDLKGMILMPGMVDGHRHCWQNQFRHLICDAGIDGYIAMTHGSTALHYRPEDMYAGDLVTLLGHRFRGDLRARLLAQFPVTRALRRGVPGLPGQRYPCGARKRATERGLLGGAVPSRPAPPARGLLPRRRPGHHRADGDRPAPGPAGDMSGDAWRLIADSGTRVTLAPSGRLRKWRCELVGADIGRVRQLAYESRDYLPSGPGGVHRQPGRAAALAGDTGPLPA